MSDTRSCPFCSAQIDQDANLCSHCRRFSSPTITATSDATGKETAIEALQRKATSWQRRHPQFTVPSDHASAPGSNLPKWLPPALALASLAYAIFTLAGWTSGLGTLLVALSLIVSSAFIAFPARFAGRGERVNSATARPDVAVRVSGFDINFAVIQFLALGAMAYFIYRWDTSKAAIAATLVIATGAIMIRTSRHLSSILTSTPALLFIIFLIFGIDSLLGWNIKLTLWTITHESGTLGMIMLPYIFMAAIISAFPVLQIVQWGPASIGGLKGDFHINLFGSQVPVSPSSSVVLTSIIVSLLAPIGLASEVWYIFM